ncbi:Photosynthetic apparatus regulatory protein RegA (plasmid) [Asticcacaulis sp. MM231]|uniref:response regulator transcription factor n=1 Tax=Asticcacaulis sp. MM231 TaxID=3157666 RepID=UPI0032D5A4E0
MRIVVLTGYASIATAVSAIQSGACHYLAKPVGVNDILSAFGRTNGSLEVPIPTEKTTLKDLEWEKINRTMMDTNYNVSETARRLRIGRRNLQRKLSLATE